PGFGAPLLPKQHNKNLDSPTKKQLFDTDAMRLYLINSDRPFHDTRLATRAAGRGNGGAIMRGWWMAGVFTTVSLSMLFAAGAFAHPASGIVVNAKGEVFFIHTGQGVCKIDTEGKVTYIH